MYEFVTHTFNTCKGICPYMCTYCYCKRWGKQNPVRFDENELKTDLGGDNFIFVGSSCDMFADDIPAEWIERTLDYCREFFLNSYLFQSKNPKRMLDFLPLLNDIDPIVCTTIETNRWYPEIMVNSPPIESRVSGMKSLSNFMKYVTIEPIIEFDLEPLVEIIKSIEPTQVNIGADSGGNNLPEPSYKKVVALTNELSKFTHIENKRNLNRLKNER